MIPDIDPHFILFKVSDMTEAGFNLKVGPQNFLNGFGFGGGLDDQQIFGHSFVFGVLGKLQVYKIIYKWVFNARAAPGSDSHQATASPFTLLHSSEYAKLTIRKQFAKVFRGNEGTGVPVAEVDHIYRAAALGQ